MALPSTTPYQLVVSPNPEAGVSNPTPVVAGGEFTHVDRETTDSYSAAVQRIAQGNPDTASAFATYLRSCLATAPDHGNYDTIVIVPGHAGGTNSALATIAATLPAERSSVLKRHRVVTPNKTIDDDDERWKNVANSVEATAPLTDRRVLVLDDILGSGASIATAAAALRETNAATVHGAVLGVRVPTPHRLQALSPSETGRTN